jgi:hypothetical protein
MPGISKRWAEMKEPSDLRVVLETGVEVKDALRLAPTGGSTEETGLPKVPDSSWPPGSTGDD